MDNFTRATKPKPRHIAANRPTHTITPAPPALLPSALPPPVLTALPPPPTPSTPPPSQASPAPRPRKRFRKKVNGLFGDHTDLKKRMARLLRPADTALLLSTPSQPGPPPSPTPTTPVLPPAQTVVRSLNATTLFPSSPPKSPSDNPKPKPTASPPNHRPDSDTESLQSFDSPAFVATASRALGSPDRLRLVRRTMGRLSPRSNIRFLQAVLSDRPRDPLAATNAHPDDAIHHSPTPPPMPSVDSSEFETEARDNSHPRDRPSALSPVSVERTGAPAVLRRKVRRLDRGYRSVDVLRARLAGMPVSEFTALPAQRRAERGRFRGVKVRRLELGHSEEGTAGPRRRVRMEAALAEGEDGPLPEGTPPKKRRLRSSAKRDEVEGEASGSVRAFDMLVEAAAVQQKQNCVRGRPFGPEEESRGSSQERPRKKKRLAASLE